MDIKEYVKQVGRDVQNWFWLVGLNCQRKNQIGRKTNVRFAQLAPCTRIGSHCNISGGKYNSYSYLGDYTELPQTKVGKFCSIASHVTLAAGNHPMAYLSTSPYTYAKIKWSLADRNYYHEEFFYLNPQEKYLCEIGNDVWIGTGAILVCGNHALHIGDGAVVAAGAVVVNDVPPYAVVAGCPAHIVRWRFNEETREKLLKLRWWDKDTRWIQEHIHQFTNAEGFGDILSGM